MNDAGSRLTVVAAGIQFSALTWGDPATRPLLLVHGVTASAEIWWRVGPALAATGRRVVAVDMPGHGRTGHWLGHARFTETAADLVEFIRMAGLATADLQVVAHSWGAMVATAMPAAGLRPSRLVLLDPPVISLAQIEAEAAAAAPVAPASLEAARAAAATEHPDWPAGDLDAVAEAAAGTDLEAARQILFENGDWDAGLSSLSGPAAAGLDVRVVRGDPTAGGLLPDEVAATFAQRFGADHVITIVGAPHSPQATHPDELLAALQQALG
jgi:pimeloyl-ACP methyl ester carboxylesterase